MFNKRKSVYARQSIERRKMLSDQKDCESCRYGKNDITKDPCISCLNEGIKHNGKSFSKFEEKQFIT